MLLLALCFLTLTAAVYFDDVDLSVPNTTQFISFYGPYADFWFGFVVSNVGDINWDGIDDVIIGCPPSMPNPGVAYVIYGQKNGIPNIDFSALTSDQGFRIQGEATGDLLGSGAGSAGDFNGDGLGDIIVGAPYLSPGGVAYVIFGSKTPIPDINLPGDLVGRGFRISGIDTSGILGTPIDCAGDVNGDGLDDLMIAAYEETMNGPSSGTVYVIFGRKTGIKDLTVPADLTSDRGFYVKGKSGIRLGYSLGAGDFNGDGIQDIVAGTFQISSPGEAYIIFGRKTGFPNYDLTLTYSSTEIGRIQGFYIQDFFGWSSGKADMNGDGIDDIIIGAPSFDATGKINVGAVYVIYGSKNGVFNINMATDFDSSKGFVIYGENGNDALGNAVSSAGDFNGDGVEDLFIGAYTASAPGKGNCGSAYVIYGDKTRVSDMDLGAGLNNTEGFKIQGTNQSSFLGAALSYAGDFNGDGGADIIVGAQYDTNSAGLKTGSAFILFGHPAPPSPPSTTPVTPTPPVAVEPIVQVQSAGAVANQAGAMVLFFGQINNGLPLLFSFLVEVLYYVRYLEISYPPRLRFMLEQPEPEYFSVDGITSAPEELEEYLPIYDVPRKFEFYGFHSSFLVNFWPSIIMFFIVLAIIIIALLLEYGTRSKKWLHEKCSSFKRAMKWNYLIAMFTGYFNDIALYTFFETRTINFESFLGGLSFLICLAMNALAGFMLIKMFLIIKKVRATTEQARMKQASSSEELDELKEQLKDFEVIFNGYKDNSFLQQSYLLLFSLRFYIFYVVVAYLYANPIAQTSIISVMGFATLAYIALKRPFEDKKDLIMSVVQETILQVVNISAFVLAVTDGEDSETDGVRVAFGDIIIGCNVAFTIVGLIYTIVMLVLMFRDVYRYIKKKCSKKVKRPFSKDFKPRLRQNRSNLSHEISSVNETHYGLTLNASSFIDQVNSSHNQSSIHLIENTPDEATGFHSKKNSRRLKMNNANTRQNLNFKHQEKQLSQQQPIVSDKKNSVVQKGARVDERDIEYISNLDTPNDDPANRIKDKNRSPFMRRDKKVIKYS